MFFTLLPCSLYPPSPFAYALFPLKEHKVKGLKAQIQTEIQKAEKAFQCM